MAGFGPGEASVFRPGPDAEVPVGGYVVEQFEAGDVAVQVRDDGAF